MRCLKIPRRYLIYCFSFFAMFLCSFLLCSSSSYAVSDLTYSGSDCSSYPYCVTSYTNFYEHGYRYLIINFDSAPSFVNNIITNFTFVLCKDGNVCSDTTSFSIPNLGSPTVIVLPSFSARRFHFTDNLSSYNTSFTFTENPPSFGGSSPSGSLSISSNGTYDVTNYAEAVVDIPPVPGDYHDDLVNIKISIIMCAGVLLVLYFFYCIYRLLIKSTGGWR